MIQKSTIQAGVICGLICVAFMWAYMSMGSMNMSAVSPKAGMHMMPDGTMMANAPEHTMDMDGSMEGMMMDMTARLQGKTGPELEKIFLEDMIVHHQGAVDMAKVLLKGTDKPELIQFANDIISLQSKEIEMQKGWLAKWFPKN
jgi:uncharacterized protein (DUF305 family)